VIVIGSTEALGHAEIHHRVGHWQRLTQIPTWFDEGLAMQVDHRERCQWSMQSGAVSSDTVKHWTSRSQFFSGDDELTRHNAMAKEEVRLWVQKVGREKVYGCQHGMNWINLGLLPGQNSSRGSADDLNRFGGFLGAMASNAGGLGSFGAHHLSPILIKETVAAIRRHTYAAVRHEPLDSAARGTRASPRAN
jgi:hypothetical protein